MPHPAVNPEANSQIVKSISEFAFVPLDRARRSPVEETPISDPSSVAATGGASADAAVALSRGFVRDMSDVITNVTDQKLREMTDISDKKFREIAGRNNYTTKGNETSLEEVCIMQICNKDKNCRFPQFWKPSMILQFQPESILIICPNCLNSVSNHKYGMHIYFPLPGSRSR